MWIGAYRPCTVLPDWVSTCTQSAAGWCIQNGRTLRKGCLSGHDRLFGNTVQSQSHSVYILHMFLCCICFMFHVFCVSTVRCLYNTNRILYSSGWTDENVEAVLGAASMYSMFDAFSMVSAVFLLFCQVVGEFGSCYVDDLLYLVFCKAPENIAVRRYTSICILLLLLL